MRMKPVAGALVFLSLFPALQLFTHSIHAQFSQDEIELTAYIIMLEMLLYKIVKGEDDEQHESFRKMFSLERGGHLALQ